MKCPQCGFRNLPNAEQCGACGTLLKASPPDSPSSFYPPRAWSRPFRQRHLEAEASRPRWWRWFPSVRRPIPSSEALAQERERRRLRRLVILTAFRSLWGLIPGLGLLREQQPQQGWRLLSAFFVCLALVGLCWRNFLSNWALWAIAGLVVYSVGVTFFAAWQRNHLPALSALQRASIWLFVLSALLWLYALVSYSLHLFGGIAHVHFTVPNDAVLQQGNALLFSRLISHLQTIKVGDYLIVDGSCVHVPLESVPWAVEPQLELAIQVGERALVRVEAFAPEGDQLVVTVPLLFGANAQMVRATVPREAVQGCVLAVINPPPQRRWLR